MHFKKENTISFIFPFEHFRIFTRDSQTFKILQPNLFVELATCYFRYLAHVHY